MSVEGRYFAWGIRAGEDLDDLTPGKGNLFKAVNLDGKHTNNGRDASGILLYGGKQGEHITFGYHGILKFTAGERIEEGKHITVVTSGYFGNVKPGDYVVGRNLSDIASGGVNTGMFNFVNPPRASVATLTYSGITYTGSCDY